MSYLPRPSTTRVPFGVRTRFPAATMRSPRVRTRIPGSAGAPEASISVRLSNRTGGACAPEPDASSNRSQIIRRWYRKKMSDKSIYNSENFPASPNYIPVAEFQVTPNGTERAVACPPDPIDAANLHRCLVRSWRQVPIRNSHGGDAGPIE
jgi:hypothetical protein